MKRYLTVSEAAVILGVCYKTVLRQIASGHIPAIRLGKRLYRIPAKAFYAAVGINAEDN